MTLTSCRVLLRVCNDNYVKHNTIIIHVVHTVIVTVTVIIPFIILSFLASIERIQFGNVLTTRVSQDRIPAYSYNAMHNVIRQPGPGEAPAPHNIGRYDIS